MKTRKLTPKQARFVEEYAIDLNATQAAIRAGYFPKRAYSTGSENLKKPEIQAAIAARREEQSQRTQITADWVLMRLREEATTGDDTKCAPARVKALELIGKHLAMFTDKVQTDNRHTLEWVLDDDTIPDWR